MTSAISVAILFLFLFANGLDLAEFSWEQSGVILILPLGFMTGLILGWKQEAKGGALAILNVAVFYLAYGILLKGDFSEGLWILFFLIPGSLLILYSALLSWRVSRIISRSSIPRDIGS